jgi:gamma-glutamylcyclotransferase (GGCT)/AIG2-like uncharacterized protein YtfP
LKDYIFFYGTLRKDCPLNPQKSLVDSLVFIGTAKIHGDLYNIGGYPGAVKRKGGSKIVGDVFLLDNTEEVLNLLDDYEGYSSHKVKESEFVRTRNRIQLDSGKSVNAWVYWYNFETGSKNRIMNGDYLNYRIDLTIEG